MTIVSQDWERDTERFQRRQRENARRNRSTAEESGDDREASRLARRDEIKRQISAAKLLRKQCDELTAVIDEINRRKEGLAQSHVERCAPIQRELVAIQSALTERIAENRPTDETLEERRRELLRELDKANEQLLGAIENEDRRLASAETDRMKIGHEAARAATEHQLLECGVVDPALHLRMYETARVHDKLIRWREEVDPQSMRFEVVSQLVGEAKRMADSAYREAVEE